MLVPSHQLAEPNTLSERQVEFSRGINSSGSGLLNLINDILDLSKIEAGKVTVEVADMPFVTIHDATDRSFRHVAEATSPPFHAQFGDGLPQSMEVDPKQQQQSLKSLISNAVKVTSRGNADVRVNLATQGFTPDHPVLSHASQVVAFVVEDKGIGIPPDKQKIIFEAFQQADAGTSRKYAGSGLGLAIRRELAMLPGGEIKLSSDFQQGSIFKLYLHVQYAGPDRIAAAQAPSHVSQAAVAREPTLIRAGLGHLQRVLSVGFRSGATIGLGASDGWSRWIPIASRCRRSKHPQLRTLSAPRSSRFIPKRSCPHMGSSAVGVGLGHRQGCRAVPLSANQCLGPLGCQLTKLFGSRPARRNFTISLARRVPTSATRFRQAGVSASMAIWSSVSLSSCASEYGVLRSLLGSSQDGSELFKDSSSMSCQVPLPQSHVACWRRSVLLSNSLSGHGFSQGCDYVVNNRSV